MFISLWKLISGEFVKWFQVLSRYMVEEAAVRGQWLFLFALRAYIALGGIQVESSGGELVSADKGRVGM